MKKCQAWLVMLFLLLLIGSSIAGADAKKVTGLEWVLPAAADIKELKAEDSSEQAKSEGLYELINGGASVYLTNGFKHAILQDYRSKGGTVFNLEIYQMDSEANAQKVFAIKGGDPKKQGTIGQGNVFEDYYGLFWQDSFYISITASENTLEAKELIKKIATAVVKKVKNKGK